MPISSLIIGKDRITFEVNGSHDLTGHLLVTVNNRKSEQIKVPLWQEIQVGFDGAGSPYLWTARSVIKLDKERGFYPMVAVSLDEDCLLTFYHTDLWVCVCEMSVRLFQDGLQIDMWETPDVIKSAEWKGGSLVIRDFNDSLTVFNLENRKLELTER